MVIPHQVLLLILCFCIFINPNGFAKRSRSPFFDARLLHTPASIEHEQLDLVSRKMEDLSVFNVTLRNILVPRVVGTESHAKVQNFIINEFKKLNWDINLDSFLAKTPIGMLQFTNIIASHNPYAQRFLDLACHYDSKYYPEANNFVGATDSAVPCAMLIQLAHSLHSALEKSKNDQLSLRFIFFDGEEAFHSWSKYDSLYGARHLARKWKETSYPEGGASATQLDRSDMLVLLDLLGAKHPEFYSFFTNTQKYYSMLTKAETKLRDRQLFKNYEKRYFHRKSTDAYIEDDHLPFLELNVPILHLITIPFPPEWHTPLDNKNIIDHHTTSNLIKILTVFIAEYLQLSI